MDLVRMSEEDLRTVCCIIYCICQFQTLEQDVVFWKIYSDYYFIQMFIIMGREKYYISPLSKLQYTNTHHPVEM